MQNKIYSFLKKNIIFPQFLLEINKFYNIFCLIFFFFFCMSYALNVKKETEFWTIIQES